MQAPFRSADGSTLLINKTDILNRWDEHYGILFDDVRSVEDAFIDNIQHEPVKPELDKPPYLEEVQTAVKKLKVLKDSSMDAFRRNVQAWRWPAPGEAHKPIHNVLEQKSSTRRPSWCCDSVPGQEQRRKVGLFKLQIKGVALLSIAGKSLAPVLLDSFIPAVAE